MNKQPMHFYSSHTVEWKGRKIQRRVAIAGIVDGCTLKFGKAECSERDNYDKPLGRKIAEGRAKTHPFHIIDITEDQINNRIPGQRITDLFVGFCKSQFQMPIESDGKV
jgi:hypothetical protein